MALPVPFFSGKDAVLRLFTNGKETILNAKSWTVTPDVTKVADGVNGEDRDRLYSFINSYNFTASCFMDKAGQIDDLLAYFGNNDAQVAPFDVAAGINIKVLDGTKKTYVAKEAVLDDFNVSNSDRKERVMLTINFRARYFDPVASL